MTAQATLLYQLQTLDLNLAKRRARVKEIAALLGDQTQLTTAQSALASAETALKPWQTRSRDLDLEIKGIAQKIKETDSLLYSGKIRNPKEMQEMQEEIASLHKRQGQLEDELIDAMVHVDDGQEVVKVAQANLKTVMATLAGSQLDLHAEQERLTAEISDLEARRKAAVQAIDPAALQKYESMRPAKRGQPVAPLAGESCKLCGVEQTSSIVHKVHQGHELIFCLSCGRILAIVS